MNYGSQNSRGSNHSGSHRGASGGGASGGGGGGGSGGRIEKLLDRLLPQWNLGGVNTADAQSSAVRGKRRRNSNSFCCTIIDKRRLDSERSLHCDDSSEDDSDQVMGMSFGEETDEIDNIDENDTGYRTAVESEVIEMRTESDGYFSVIVTEEPRQILITRHPDSLINFRDITIDFPLFSVLGSRTVHIEVVFPKDIRLSSGCYLVTPVVYISQKSHRPFLRKVKVTLPLSEDFVAKGNVVQSNVLNKQLKLVKNELCVVRSHTFSPVAVKQSITDAAAHVLQCVDSFDEEKLFDPSKFYFLMRQVREGPEPDGKHRLQFSCQQFSDWRDHDMYRWRENWHFSPLILPETTTSVKVKIKASGILKMRRKFTLQFPLQKQKREIHFTQNGFHDNPAGEQNPQRENLQNGSQSVEENRKLQPVHEERYRFHSNTTLEGDSTTKPVLQFQYLSFKRFFPILTEDALKALDTNQHIYLSKEALIEFLTIIGANWSSFLTNELNVMDDYLRDFVIKDILDEVNDFLETSVENLLSDNERESQFAEYEQIFLQNNTSFEIYATRDLKENDPKERILLLCRKALRQIQANKITEVAKIRIMRNFDLDFQNLGLTDMNKNGMAEVLLCVENRTLFDVISGCLREKKYCPNVDIEKFSAICRTFGTDIVVPEGDNNLQ